MISLLKNSIKIHSYTKLVLLFVTVIVLISALNSCFPIYQNTNETNSLSSQGTNVASLYNPYIASLHPIYTVYNKDTNTSVIVAKVYKSEILFNNANPEKTNKGKVKFRINVFKIDNDSRIFVDTLTFLYDVELKSYENVFFAYMPVKREAGAKYSLHIIYSDILKRKFAVSFLDLNEITRNTEQNYTTFKIGSRVPEFKRYFDKENFFRLQSNVESPDSLYVQYFSNQFHMPLPPASITKPEIEPVIPDTTYKIKNRPQINVLQNNEGMYRYTTDTATNNGLTLFTFSNEHYPRLKTSAEMVKPLQYLTSRKEYVQLTNVQNQKLALDKFWLSLSRGDEEKARQLIKIFYTRVMFANNYFLSYTEGWKTDRGMIYIMYGPPRIIRKNHKKEKWIYGNPRNSQALAFTFYKREHPFTSNRFELLRSNIYSSSWRKAVKSWRAGEAYSGK